MDFVKSLKSLHYPIVQSAISLLGVLFDANLIHICEIDVVQGFANNVWD